MAIVIVMGATRILKWQIKNLIWDKVQTHYSYLHLCIADTFIQSDFVHSGIHFQYVCSLGLNPRPFALLTQFSTTESQEHSYDNNTRKTVIVGSKICLIFNIFIFIKNKHYFYLYYNLFVLVLRWKTMTQTWKYPVVLWKNYSYHVICF